MVLGKITNFFDKLFLGPVNDVEDVGHKLNDLLPLYVLYKSDRRFHFLKIYIGSQIYSEALKNLINSERPDRSDTCSFPSGHALSGFSSAEYSLHHLNNGKITREVEILYTLATFLAYTRIHADRHRIRDVSAAYLISKIVNKEFK